MFEIEKNIPMPSSKHAQYPYEKLEVGDSFFVPAGNVGTFRSKAQYMTKKTGKKFTTRAVEGGLRIWRSA